MYIHTYEVEPAHHALCVYMQIILLAYTHMYITHIDILHLKCICILYSMGWLRWHVYISYMPMYIYTYVYIHMLLFDTYIYMTYIYMYHIIYVYVHTYVCIHTYEECAQQALQFTENARYYRYVYICIYMYIYVYHCKKDYILYIIYICRQIYAARVCVCVCVCVCVYLSLSLSLSLSIRL